MEYSIRIDDERQMIVSTVNGEWELLVGRRMSREVMETVQATGFKLVLVDMRELVMRITILQIYERAKELWDEREEFQSYGVRVAVVFTFNDPQFKKNMLFFETVSQNRGLPYRVFASKQEGLDWLLEP